MGFSGDVFELEMGDDVVDELTAASRGVDGWVQAVGHVEDAELRMAGEGADPRRSFYGRLTLVQLSGPAGGPYMATLARVTSSGAELVGGRLLRARAAGVHAVVLPTRGAAPEEPAAAPEPSETEAAPAPAPSGWAAVAQHTAVQAMPDEDPEVDQSPEPGDLVHHFAFGLCDVLTAKGDSLKIRDAHGPGRIREVRVDMLQVMPPTEKNGKRLFKLVRKK